MRVMELVEIVNVPRIEQIVWHPADMSVKIDGGIYRMFNDLGEVIYVGKSSNLHTRILNHTHLRTHIAHIMDEVAYIEWHEEPDPVFQTLLESIFIAYHLPKYNDEVHDAKAKFGDDYGLST
jgi:excinuclease UvrABC nuclease subunit